MNTVIEVISFAAIVGSLVAALSYAIVLNLRLKKSQSKLMQSLIDINHTKSKLSEALLEIESKKLEETDGFVKFVSESRNWAFQYIEDVQNTIVVIKNDWDNNKVEESIEKLFDFLPENNKEK